MGRKLGHGSDVSLSTAASLRRSRQEEPRIREVIDKWVEGPLRLRRRQVVPLAHKVCR